MEKFFKINKENRLYSDYFSWFNSIEEQYIKWQEFKETVGIESNAFIPCENLGIIPTENDLKKFGRLFLKGTDNYGVKKFKKTATIQKQWKEFAIKNPVVLKQRPDVVVYFIMQGLYCSKFQTRLFHNKDEIYCSIDADFPNNFENPKEFIEIKGSEFYPVLESVLEEN